MISALKWKSVCQAGIGLVLAASSMAAFAHGATRQKIVESVQINAPAAKVWALVGAFNDWGKWLPQIAKSTMSSGVMNGSFRYLTLKGADKPIIETLDDLDAKDMMIHYRIREVDTKVFPVSTYSSIISVTADSPTTSTVEWKGAFFRADQNFDPPPGQDDAAAIKAVTDLYQTGLANLKKVAESSH